MLKLPQSIIYGVIGINITGFAVLLQLDMLTIRSIEAKIVAWTLTIGIWALAYMKRKKYYTLF